MKEDCVEDLFYSSCGFITNESPRLGDCLVVVVDDGGVEGDAQPMDELKGPTTLKKEKKRPLSLCW